MMEYGYYPWNAGRMSFSGALRGQKMNNNRRFFLGAAIGLLFGLMIGSALTLLYASKQIRMRDGLLKEHLEQSNQESQKTAQKTIDAWQSRAEKCEVKERFMTVLYEYRPGTSIPVLHGAFSINLGSEGNHPPADLKPVWVIPVQTPVYTSMEGASYEWVNGKTGETIGRFPAVAPPSVPQ